MEEDDVVMFKHLQIWLNTDSLLEAGEKPPVILWRTLIDIYGQYMGVVVGEKLGLLNEEYERFRRGPPYTKSPECPHGRHVR